MLKVVKKLPASLLLAGSLLLSIGAFAQDEGSLVEQLKQFLQDEQQNGDKTQRELWQDWKQYFGLTNLKNIETQNVMRLMLPPGFDETLTIGSRVLAAEDAINPWQETLVRDTANYNINTPEEDSTNVAFLSPRINQWNENGKSLVDAQTGLNDLLANTLLGGLAFDNDQQAEDAYLYIRRLTNFSPIKALPADEMFTDDTQETLTDAGIAYLMKVYKQLPAMTLAQNSLLAIHTEKQRFKEFGLGLPIGDQATQSASLMEVMAYEVERRYMSTQWHDEMNQMSTEGLLKEMANMMAFQMYLDFKRYEQGQRTEALLAGQMGMLSGLIEATGLMAPQGEIVIPEGF